MPRPPRILFLITDLHLGGSPLMLATLAPGLRPRFDVHVASLAPLPAENPIVVARLRAANIPVHSLNLAAVSAKSAAAGLGAYRKLLEEIQPDLVYSILIHANALATLGKQFSRHKLIHSIHTLQPEPRWHWTLEGTIAKSADAVFAPSPAILDEIAKFGPFQRGVVIPNGIDTARFQNATPILPPNPAAAPELRLGYIGRFDPVKRLETLLPTLSTLRSADHNASLYLIGYGQQKSALENLANSLHLAPHVHFPGPTNEPERWYKSFSIHVLPSPVEGFGLTLVEALAAGIPIVAVNTPATAQIVRPGIDGVLVPSPNPASLTSGIAEVARWLVSGHFAPPRSQSWAESKFSAQAMIHAHAENLEKILRD